METKVEDRPPNRVMSLLFVSSEMTTLVLIVLALLSGCGKSELDRSGAKRLIEKHFSPAECTLQISTQGVRSLPAALATGLREGFWNQFWSWVPAYVGGAPVQWGIRPQLTDRGARAFARLDLGAWDAKVTLRAPVQRRVEEVTGITDAPSGPPGTAKVVEFTWRWNWDTVSDDVKLVFSQAPPVAKGKGLMKLHDDGWRVEALGLE